MLILKDVESLKKWRNTLNGNIGFIPTMGALHEGHLSLIKNSRNTCDNTIVSIFVNPTQFNNEDDFKNYPSTLQNDLEQIKLHSTNAVFLPTNKMMYPENFSTYVEENDLSTHLEGDSRPGHFKGVTTIIAKFFNIIQPTHAFFGKKDAQQLRVIQQMVKDLNFNVKIIPCKIIREKSGLAMSSRNKNLSPENRKKASIIKKGLDLAKIALDNGERSTNNLKKYIHSKINSEPIATIIYVSIADNNSMLETEKIENKDILISVAVNFGNIRLIDNFTYSVS